MTQPVAYGRDGVPLREEDIQGALESGNAGFQPDAKVWMQDPATREDRVVSAAEASSLAQQGYQYLPSNYVAARKDAASRRREFDGGLANTAGALAEGAASGLTFGMFDQAAAGGFFGDDYARGVRGRAEFNPTARTLGEIGGTVAPVLLSGGTGTAGAVARTAGAAPVAVSRLGASAERGVMSLLGSAAEGTAARRILGRTAGMGAGGAVEGGVYGLGTAVRDAALNDTELTAEKLLSAAGEGALFGGVLSGGLGALTSTGSEGVRRLLSGKGARQGLSEFAERQAVRQLLDRRGVNKALSYGGEARLQRIGRELLDEGIPLSGKGWQARAQAAVTTKLDDAARKMETVSKQMDDAGVRIDSRAMAKSIDDKIESLRGSTSGTERRIADTLESEWAPLRDMIVKRADDGTTHYLKGSFDDIWKARQKLDKVIFQTDRLSPARDAMRGMRDSMDAAMDDALRNQPDLVSKWSAAKSKYADYATVRDSLKRKSAQEASNAFVSGGDRIAGAAGSVLGLVTGMGHGAGAGALASLAGGAALGAASRYARDQGAGIMAQAANKLSKMDTRLAVASQRLSGMSTLQALPRTVVPTGSALKQQFDRTRRELNAMRDPSTMAAMLQRSTGDLAREEPALALAMQTRLAGDVAYLQNQMPQGYTSGGKALTPMAGEPRWSQTDMAKFVRVANALAEPESVLDAVADGKVDRDAIEAIKERRPRLYASMRERVMSYTASRGEEMPYKQRVSLSLAFDFQGDSSLQPGTMSQIQTAFIPPDAEKPGPSGKLDISDQAKATQLPSDVGQTT